MKGVLLLIKYLPTVMKLLPQVVQLVDGVNCAIRGKCGNNYIEAMREKTKLNEAVTRGSLKDIMAIRDRLLQ